MIILVRLQPVRHTKLVRCYNNQVERHRFFRLGKRTLMCLHVFRRRSSATIELRMGHPERGYSHRRRSARAFSSDERGSGTRDSKIEIVRAAALVLEPWVTAAVESRRFQSRRSSPDRPPFLAPFSFSRGSNKYRRDRTALSLSLPLMNSPEFNQEVSTLKRELDCARMLDDLFSIRVDLIFMSTTRKEGRKGDEREAGPRRGQGLLERVSSYNYVLLGCYVS